MLASSTTFVAEPTALATRRTRIDSKAFWVLYAIEGVIIAAICAFVLQLLLPSHTPLAKVDDTAVVREAVFARLSGSVADPLIELAPGDTARASNVRGFTRAGVTYYYYLEGAQSFDPLSRGVLNREQIEVVLRDTSGPVPLVIYARR